MSSKSTSSAPSAEAEDLRRVLTELAVPTTEAALLAIRTLKAHALNASTQPLATLPSEGTLTEAGDTRKLMEKLRLFASKIDNLNGTVSSMENQLQSLYSDRERLESEIGASEVDDVILAFDALKMTIQSMEKQLMTLYARWEILEVELGKSDPQEIVAMFRNVTNLIGNAHQELVTAERN